MIWRFLYWDSIYWYWVLILLLNWKLNEESPKKVSFENWKLGNTEKMKVIEGNTLFSTSKMRWGSYKLTNTISRTSYKAFASWKINVIYTYIIYIYFYNNFSTVLCGRYCFLLCYMACYNFPKLVNAKDRSRNFAISKMGLCVTMV